jgi:hypothetical protein
VCPFPLFTGPGTEVGAAGVEVGVGADVGATGLPQIRLADTSRRFVLLSLCSSGEPHSDAEVCSAPVTWTASGIALSSSIGDPCGEIK